MEHYSALKREEIQIHGISWIDLEDVLQGEIKQSQKDRYCMITLTWVPRVFKLIETESRMVAVSSWGSEEWEVIV